MDALSKIRDRLGVWNWSLEWIPMEANEATDAAAVFSVLNNVNLLVEQSNVEDLSRVCKDRLALDCLSIAA